MVHYSAPYTSYYLHVSHRSVILDYVIRKGECYSMLTALTVLVVVGGSTVVVKEEMEKERKRKRKQAKEEVMKKQSYI